MREGTGWTRRAFLASVAAAGVLVPRGARALGAAGKLDIAEIQLSRGTLSRPDAWTRLLHELLQSTSVEAEPRVVQVAPDDPDLFKHPFAVLVGDAELPRLGDAAQQQLARYLQYGGFLLVDDASGQPAGPFARSVRGLATQIFPTRPLTVLPSDHSVYRSFFLLREAVGRVARVRHLEGIPQGSMHPLVVCHDDLSGALDRRADGSDRNACVPGGEDQRREAIKLGINLVMYALTSNYKQDQAHVKQLMQEGRLE